MIQFLLLCANYTYTLRTRRDYCHPKQELESRAAAVVPRRHSTMGNAADSKNFLSSYIEDLNISSIIPETCYYGKGAAMVVPLEPNKA